MEDFILFANPMRESWEKSSKMIEAIKLQPGEKVADIGSGPGYFSFKFAELVGPKGKVYAVDNDDDHLAYLEGTIKRLQIPNVTAVMPQIADIGIKDKVDVVYMCSLYHNLYAIMTDEERDALIDSIKSILKPDGRFVLVDNGPVSGTLPYHGPFITREMIIAQFKYQGFDLVETNQFIPQRYMLTFKMRADAKKPGEKWAPAPVIQIPEGGLIAHDIKSLPATPGVAEFVDGDTSKIHVLSHRSILRTLITGNSPTFTEKGRKAAEIMYNGLKNNDNAKLKEAHELYETIIPTERTGDEYSALDWFCLYKLATPEERKKMITSPMIEEYADFFAGHDFKTLITYLKNKYVIGDLEAKMQEMGKTEEERLKKLGVLSTNEKGETIAPANPRELTATQNVNKGGPPRAPVTDTKGETPKGDAPKTDGKNPPALEGKDQKAPPSSTMVTPNTSIPPRPTMPGDTSAKTQAGEEIDAPPPPYQSLPLDVEVNTLIEWWEYLAFMNPRRAEWEHTDTMLKFVDVKPGQAVADVGSGAGYYTFKFAERVGPTGKVYALDFVREQLENVVRAGKRAGLTNILTVASKENDCTLPENSIDVAWLCSLYHATYVTSIEYVKDSFVNSLKKAIKPGGRLIIVDNMPLSDKKGGYYGPRISKEMIIPQIEQYGFKFESYGQFIPQRYVLIFTNPKKS
jgi:predicted methyltransferase